MGRDKATIEFEGEPLWKRQLEILRVLRPEKILDSASSTPSWLPDDVELLLDDPPSRGPLSGLTKALATMRTSHLIVVAVDMPFMTGGELGRIWSFAKIGCGVVPTIDGRAEPLAAVYPAQASPDFAGALAGADFSLQRLIQKIAAKDKIRLLPVPAGNEHLYRSVNKPTDL